MGFYDPILKPEERTKAPAPTGGSFYPSSFTGTTVSREAPLAITPMTNQTTPMMAEGTVGGIGGVVGAVGGVFSIGQYAAMSTLQTILGLQEGKTFSEKFQARPTGSDVLRQVGAKEKPTSTLGKLVTGSTETPVNEPFSKTFAKELVPTAIGIAGDIFLDPLTWLSSVGAIKSVTSAARTAIAPFVEKIASTKIGSMIGSRVITRFGQPELFQEMDKLRKIDESLVGERVSPLVDDLLKERSAVQQQVAQVIKGGITTDDHIRALATPIRVELDRVGAEISKVNPKLLDPATFEANKGTYFPRLFTKYEFPEEGIEGFFKTSSTRIPTDRFIARKDLPDEVLKQLGEIKEAGFPAAKGLTQLNVAEIRGKFFKNVADNFANDVPALDLVQLAESKTLGALSGKFVPTAIADAINGIVKTVSPGEELYLKALTTWKTFKTAYNPATISRNDLTNFLFLNPLGGVAPYRLDIYAKTTREMFSNGPIYRAAKQNGFLISNQAAAELLNKAKTIYTRKQGLIGQFFGSVQDFHRAIVNFYGHQDKFFKLANIIKGVGEDGLSIRDAVKRANFYLIDYSEVPKVVEWLRKTPFGIPFISFTYGVSKPLAKTLLERPDKLANYFKILREIQNMNPYDETQEQRIKEFESMPDYIQKGQFLKVPVRDSTGRTMYLDLQYIMPFNPIEMRSLIPGQNPAIALFADLMRNKSGFTGREVWLETDTQAEATIKAARYAWQTLAPNNPLVPESWSFEKMQDVGMFPRLENGNLVFEERPDKLGRERTKILGILDTIFGIKITPLDDNFERLSKIKGTFFELNDLRSQMRSVMKSKTILPKEKAERIKNLQEKIKSLVQ